MAQIKRYFIQKSKEKSEENRKTKAKSENCFVLCVYI